MLKITRYGEVTRIDSARTMAGRGTYWTTAYLVDGLLIDTGCAHSSGEFVSRLDGKKLSGIFNTHSHEDHIGANGELQVKRKGLEILAHPLALPVLENPRGKQPLQLYRRVMWGWPKPCKGRAVDNGETIQTEGHTFQVIYTPGHSPDHICLYEPEQGWLFSGDLFVGGRDRALRADANILQIIASLKQLVHLPLSRLYPGSARVRENPKEALINKIEYLEEMGDKVLALHRQGKREREIVRTLFSGPMLIELITLGHFARIHLVRSYLEGEKLS